MEWHFAAARRRTLQGLQERGAAARAAAVRARDEGAPTGPLERRARWYEHRARSLALERRDLLATCQRRAVAFRCGCRTIVRTVGCGQRWYCDHCRATYYRRTRRRATQAIAARLREARADWHRGGRRRGERPDAVLVTLTMRHSGDVSGDRTTLQRGWERLRKWAWQQLRRRGRDGAFPYLLTWEFTPGADGLGHVHAHVLCVWPWLDWDDVREEWIRATGGESLSVDLKHCGERLGEAVTAGAQYIAKYASKGVRISDGMDPRLAAHVLSAFYGRRLVSASRGFWVPRRPECRTCGCLSKLAQAPATLVSVAGASVLRARLQQILVTSRRGRGHLSPDGSGAVGGNPTAG